MAKRALGQDWAAADELLDLLRAALEHSDVMSLVYELRESRKLLPLAADRSKENEQLESEKRLTSGVRVVLGRFLVSALRQGLIPPEKSSESSRIEAQRSQSELVEILAAIAEPVLVKLLKQDSFRELTTEFLNTLLKPVVDKVFGALSELREEHRKILTAVDAETQAVNQIINSPQRVLDLLYQGPLRDRYEKDYYDEKLRIGRFLAENVFNETVSCFLQASTTIMHLAECLRGEGSLVDGSLIHTNSTVFAYLMLGRASDFQIYTLCGKEHDAKCGGWLIDESDDEAQAHLRSLFRRDVKKNPLTTAIITPQFLTLDGRAWFSHPKTSLLVRVLLQESPHVIVTTPGQRIFNNEDSLHGDAANQSATFTPVRLRTDTAPGREPFQQSCRLLVSGPTSQLPLGADSLKQLAAALKATCLWCDTVVDDWRVVHECP